MHDPTTQRKGRKRDTGYLDDEDMQISNAAPLPYEIFGVIQDTGEPLTLLQTCNWPGHSPSVVGIKSDGTFVIASFSEVRARDNRVVPNPRLFRDSDKNRGRYSKDRDDND